MIYKINRNELLSNYRATNLYTLESVVDSQVKSSSKNLVFVRYYVSKRYPCSETKRKWIW